MELQELRQKIKEVAEQYEGIIEKPNNSGWYDVSFETKMKNLGWIMGEPWCACFVKQVWIEACDVLKYKFVSTILKKQMTKSAYGTYLNLTSNGFWVNKIPEQGDLVCWRNYIIKNKVLVPTWHGHIGIDLWNENDSEKHFITLDGNSNPEGGREGYIIGRIERNLNFEIQKGLTLLGFIKPRII